MEKYTTQNNHRTSYWREFESYEELIDIARRRVRSGQDDYGNSSITGGYDFTGTKNLSEAIRLAEQGWADGTDRIRKVADSIEVPQDIVDDSHRLTLWHDVVGDEPDIGRFVEGQPEHMIEFRAQQLKVGKIINLFVSVSQDWLVERSSIVNRGATILAAIEALQTRGYSLGLYVVEQSFSGRSNLFSYRVPLIEPGQITNIDTIGFAIMHPSFLRRFIFAANEAESYDLRCELGAHSSGGYGKPVGKILHPKNMQINGSTVEKDFGLTNSKKSMVKNAQTIVDNCIESLRVKH